MVESIISSSVAPKFSKRPKGIPGSGKSMW
uniref:Ribosomal protein L32 n=1 Tax=Haemonchus contortus TaxID=6289 RepID=A0A7I4YTY8_HAECO